MAPKKKRNEMKHSNIICLRLSDIELELVNHAASQAKLSGSDYQVSKWPYTMRLSLKAKQ